MSVCGDGVSGLTQAVGPEGGAPECLRDIGLDRDCIEVAAHGDNMKHTRWCYSMAGDEFARIYSWGNDPKRKVGGTTCPRCTGGLFACEKVS